MDYLSLVHPPAEVKRIEVALKHAPHRDPQGQRPASAAGLELLPADHVEVAADLAKAKKGERLSPVLLVRGDFTRGVPLVIADGYVRVCRAITSMRTPTSHAHLRRFPLD